MRNKRIFVLAYTQMNLGDDLFIKILCDRYPETRFYIMSTVGTSVALRAIDNLTVIPYIPVIDGVLKRLHIKLRINRVINTQLADHSDATVNIGGSIFIQAKDWESSVKDLEKRLKRGKPYYILGCNFGPYFEQAYYDQYKALFGRVKDICFRDQYSYQLFEDLENARYADDIIFTYDVKEPTKVQDQVVLSVIDLAHRSDLKAFEKVYVDKLVEISKKFIKEGYTVCLTSFCEREGDSRMIHRLLHYFTEDEKNKLRVHPYTGNLEQTLKVIGESKYVVGSRFHAMILGWIYHKPVFPIIYSNKSLEVITDIGFNGEYASIKALETLDVDRMYKALCQLEPQDISQQVANAKQQFIVLDEYILGEEL